MNKSLIIKIVIALGIIILAVLLWSSRQTEGQPLGPGSSAVVPVASAAERPLRVNVKPGL
ncbi:MAG: hypothetical protein A3H72_03450 [Candidatus Doudnabacteria bacterium RIFCSPLOWO2_02_FULL_48_8]|uniref:Uncharacterized protein n=1 Tax=Candidatus Doudnabacteria bacterium RIFCSPHIGHO2_01_FULL_46_24 TaxID=1817825 RepID=A0A1F5NU13_9BACT|nr:MAG: hypothetical protein A2720_01280 [Candidatus Doudnabacteria bacterium RIFCSPHIGHO2_01_FULL_46_24]OGE95522.1 MAG: hypothetical protein A3H72_03450 [Candidatus Doudnabacteria bacterium RIFCSPLOWO2_02_FULL_48_8]OGE96070.1 MAG: hypothetical protein A3E98_02380 [Candidatus Doudnabacteria bacterium RIFCSPHIGHO2_12_FULL_48_11]